MPSKQYRWQLKQLAAGNCKICGKPREHYKQLCDIHQLARRIAVRKQLNTKPWQPGSRGKKPFIYEEIPCLLGEN